jgi:hypothetical protein
VEEKVVKTWICQGSAKKKEQGTSSKHGRDDQSPGSTGFIEVDGWEGYEQGHGDNNKNQTGAKGAEFGT